MEPLYYCIIGKKRTVGLHIQLFDDINHVTTDVVFYYVCPENCVKESVECLLEIDDDILLVTHFYELLNIRYVEPIVCHLLLK